MLKEKRPTEHSIDFGKMGHVEFPALSPQNAAIQDSESSKRGTRRGGPFKGEHDLVSFAD